MCRIVQASPRCNIYIVATTGTSLDPQSWHPPFQSVCKYLDGDLSTHSRVEILSKSRMYAFESCMIHLPKFRALPPDDTPDDGDLSLMMADAEAGAWQFLEDKWTLTIS